MLILQQDATLEDQAEHAFYRDTKADPETIFMGFLFRNAREQYSYRMGETFRPFQFRSRGGALVALAYHCSEKTIGVIPLLTEEPSRSQLRSADSFLARYDQSCVVFVSRVKRPAHALDDRRLILDCADFLLSY